ncbi:MAG: class D sortase [Chloroflexi bacterium]|nr:class D sortase [Chloroflexota bacterium]
MATLRISSFAFLVLGGLILALVAGYRIYAWNAEREFPHLNRRLPSSPSLEYRGDFGERGEAPGKSKADSQQATTSAALPGGETTPLPHSATQILIPSIGVDSKVVELGVRIEDTMVVWETADHAVGHHQGTAQPGEKGNIVMSGHISSPLKGEGDVFRRLPEIGLGDEVIIDTQAGQHRYRVVETQVVLPTDTWVMAPTPQETLTLITCVPDWVYSHRLIVTAKPVASSP